MAFLTIDIQPVKFIKFVLFGTFNTLGTWAIFVLCYSILNFSTQLSLLAAYITGFIFSLVSWTFIVFKVGGLNLRKVIGTIFLMLCTYIIQSVCLKVNEEASLFHPALVSLLVAIALVLPSFLFLDKYVHRKQPCE